MITLSYIMTTYNKLAYLKITLPYLINACKEDEEIVIADGGSTDGTKEYLEELLNQKKIHQFVSEKDFGEAHGTNKTFLLAKGAIIKLITDDDIYHYPTIQKCKQFMLANKQIDILGFDGLGFNINHSLNAYDQSNFIDGFKTWKVEKTPFLFCGLSYTIRKSALAYMGLFNSNFKIVDVEYSIRVSSMKTQIAFYTGLGYVNIVNPESNSHKYYDAIKNEKKILFKLYPNFKKSYSLKKGIIKVKELASTYILRKSVSTDKKFDYEKIVMDSVFKLNEINANILGDFLI